MDNFVQLFVHIFGEFASLCVLGSQLFSELAEKRSFNL